MRTLYRRAETPRQASRSLPWPGVAEGRSRDEAARLGDIDRQTLRDWGHLFNTFDLQGLIDHQAPGPRRRLTTDQRAELAKVIEASPEPERDGIVRWRRSDLRRLIRQRHGVDYHERHVGRLLYELSFAHISARPRHVGQPPAARLAVDYLDDRHPSPEAGGQDWTPIGGHDSVPIDMGGASCSDGPIVLATLLAERSNALRRRDYHALHSLCGVAPVTKRSGKRLVVVMRQACQMRLRNAVYRWARVATQHDAKSRQRYQALRARGHSHARALRSVGNRLLGVACAMLTSGQTFRSELTEAPQPS